MPQQEWESLFDGETTTGWHSYGQKEAGTAWKAADGVLYLDTAAKEREGATGGDLLTEGTYSDFHLKLDWKLGRGGNSGLLFYVQEDPMRYEKSWQSGPEIQLLDNALHADAIIPKRRAGDMYDLISSDPETVKPAGQWNHLELICQSGRVQLYLNEVQTLQAVLWTEEWQQLVQQSKFKDIPGFGMYKSGHIALQDHRDEVWFRNIYIRQL